MKINRKKVDWEYVWFIIVTIAVCSSPFLLICVIGFWAQFHIGESNLMNLLALLFTPLSYLIASVAVLKFLIEGFFWIFQGRMNELINDEVEEFRREEKILKL